MKTNKRIEIFKRLFDFIRLEKNSYYMLAIFKILLLATTLVTPLFYKILIEDVIIDKKISLVFLVILGYVGVYLIETLILSLNKKAYNTLFLKMNIALKQKIFRNLSSMEYEEILKYDAGDLAKRSDSDIDVVERFFDTHILDFCFAIASVTAISIILLYMSWKLALFGFLMIPISFLFSKFMAKKTGKVSEKLREQYGKHDTFVHNTFQNWKDIKSNNLEENEDKILADIWNIITPLRIKAGLYWYFNRAFIAFKDEFITKMNLYFLGGVFIINGSMEVAVLLVFMNYYDKFFKNISLLTDAIVSLKTDEPSIERVLDIIEKKDSNKPTFDIKDSNVRLENVSFKYNDEQGLVLKNADMQITEKEHVAIVGRSGCGKTTLAKLLLGLYYPNEGNIFVGGYNISNISNECLNMKISIVMQNPSLLNLSFKDNLLLAKYRASKDEIEDACKMANIYEFIYSLPEKFDTIIGEKGIKLSGGQKQRLAIARTFLFDPDIIIFDEATSSLDSESEKAIVETIEKLSSDKTLITIAHRFSSVINADRIYVMDEGKIVVCGSHNELKGNNDIYDMMFAGQYNII